MVRERVTVKTLRQIYRLRPDLYDLVRTKNCFLGDNMAAGLEGVDVSDDPVDATLAAELSEEIDEDLKSGEDEVLHEMERAVTVDPTSTELYI